MEPAALPTTILTVDDQPANLRLLIDSLEQRGLHVVVAQSGQEGIDRAEFVHPDLILLDVQMEGLDGFETCRRLKANPRTREIPVIFMTVVSDTRDKLAGFAAGGVDYVTKPINEAEVLARMDTHIALNRLQRQLEQRNAQLQREIAERELVQAALQRSNVELEQLAIERAVRVKAEGESAGLRRLLEERDQMLAEREELLRLLAHEVRQPLNNASAALETASAAIVASGQQVASDVRSPLVRARQVLDHVIGTLNNTLAAATMLSSGASEAIADTDLDTLIGLVIHDVALDERARLDAHGAAPAGADAAGAVQRAGQCAGVLAPGVDGTPRDQRLGRPAGHRLRGVRPGRRHPGRPAADGVRQGHPRAQCTRQGGRRARPVHRAQGGEPASRQHRDPAQRTAR
jgi:CheY-like chemotaxis protein